MPPRPLFAELLAALPVPVLLIDPAGRIGYANSEAELLLNLSERAMQGQGLGHAMVPPEGYGDRRAGLGFAAYDTVIETMRGGRVRIDFIEALVADHPGWRIITLHHGAASRPLGQADRAAARSAGAASGARAITPGPRREPLPGGVLL